MEYVKKYASNPEMLERAKSQLEEKSKEEKREEDSESGKGSDLSATSLKSDEEDAA